MSEVLGRCPGCGAEYVDGYYGLYCTGKCGFRLRRVLGRDLGGEQISALLKGETVLSSTLENNPVTDGSCNFNAATGMKQGIDTVGWDDDVISFR